VPTTRHQLFCKGGAERRDLFAVRTWIPKRRFLFCSVPFARSRKRSQHGRLAATHRGRCRSRNPDHFVANICPYLDSNWTSGLFAPAPRCSPSLGDLRLGLAVVGLYGVKTYSVARRTREIGIRMALGAQPGMVLRLIMREGSIMLLTGIALGLLLAAATGKILDGILFEIGAFDPVAFASALIVLSAATLLATWLPARRATRINPMVALRTE